MNTGNMRESGAEALFVLLSGAPGGLVEELPGVNSTQLKFSSAARTHFSIAELKLLEKLARLGADFYTCRSFVEENRLRLSGHFITGFCYSLDNYILEGYRYALILLERKIIEEQITSYITFLCDALVQYMKFFPLVAQFIAQINIQNLNGSSLLTRLHQIVFTECDQSLRKMILPLFRTVNGVLIKMITRWCQGEWNEECDPYDEFFIFNRSDQKLKQEEINKSQNLIQSQQQQQLQQSSSSIPSQQSFNFTSQSLSPSSAQLLQLISKTNPNSKQNKIKTNQQESDSTVVVSNFCVDVTKIPSFITIDAAEEILFVGQAKILMKKLDNYDEYEDDEYFDELNIKEQKLKVGNQEDERKFNSSNPEIERRKQERKKDQENLAELIQFIQLPKDQQKDEDEYKYNFESEQSYSNINDNQHKDDQQQQQQQSYSFPIHMHIPLSASIRDQSSFPQIRFAALIHKLHEEASQDLYQAILRHIPLRLLFRTTWQYFFLQRSDIFAAFHKRLIDNSWEIIGIDIKQLGMNAINSQQMNINTPSQNQLLSVTPSQTNQQNSLLVNQQKNQQQQKTITPLTGAISLAEMERCINSSWKEALKMCTTSNTDGWMNKQQKQNKQINMLDQQQEEEQDNQYKGNNMDEDEVKQAMNFSPVVHPYIKQYINYLQQLKQQLPSQQQQQQQSSITPILPQQPQFLFNPNSISKYNSITMSFSPQFPFSLFFGITQVNNQYKQIFRFMFLIMKTELELQGKGAYCARIITNYTKQLMQQMNQLERKIKNEKQEQKQSLMNKDDDQQIRLMNDRGKRIGNRNLINKQQNKKIETEEQQESSFDLGFDVNYKLGDDDEEDNNINNQSNDKMIKDYEIEQDQLQNDDHKTLHQLKQRVQTSQKLNHISKTLFSLLNSTFTSLRGYFCGIVIRNECEEFEKQFFADDYKQINNINININKNRNRHADTHYLRVIESHALLVANIHMQLFLTNRIITQTISDIIDITMEFIQTVDSLPYIQDVYQKIRGTIITGTDMDVMISRLAADKLPSLALSTSAQTISDSIQTATLETKERIIEQVTEHINALQIEASQKFGLLYRMFSALHAELSSLALPLPGQSSVPQTATIAGAQRIHPNIIHLLTLLNYNGFASRLEESSKKI